MRSSVLTAILLAVVVVPAAAGVRLILRDGRVLEGTDIRREGQAYLLTLEDGGIVPIPDALVEGVALSDEGTDEDAPATVWPPTGLTDSRPQQLAGEAVSPSLRAEQTRALGPPSRFQQSMIDPN